MKSLPKKENSTVEFKSSFGDETIETLVAFANTKGGKVLVGVANNSYSAYARNKLITEAFYLTGDIEKYGSGFLRIRNAISLYPTMKMDFKEIGGGFMVTVSYTKQKTNTDVPENTENVPENAENVPENRFTAIIDLIKDNPEISMMDLSNMLNVSHKTIKRDIQILKSKGLLERLGADKGGYWKVVKRIRK
ncbi:hypothetical protein R83H12_01670 [Fibrobacteria bacterium R8-3-H12]